MIYICMLNEMWGRMCDKRCVPGTWFHHKLVHHFIWLNQLLFFHPIYSRLSVGLSRNSFTFVTLCALYILLYSKHIFFRFVYVALICHIDLKRNNGGDGKWRQICLMDRNRTEPNQTESVGELRDSWTINDATPDHYQTIKLAHHQERGEGGFMNRQHGDDMVPPVTSQHLSA